MTTFQPGQKVRFIGEHAHEGDPPAGAQGIIVEKDPGIYEGYVVDYGVAEILTFDDELEAAS